MSTLISLHEKLDKLDTDIHFIVVYCHGERYIFTYDAKHLTVLLMTLGRFAANDDLAFTWADAATVIKKVIEQEKHP